MSVLPLVCDFVDEQRSLLDEDLNLVVKNIIEYIQSINSSEFATGHVWGSRELDDLTIDVGRRILNTVDTGGKGNKTTKTYVYIASELHKTGGHTAALLKIVELKRDFRHIIFVTNILDEFDGDVFGGYLAENSDKPAEIITVPDMSLSEKIGWLQLELKKYSPEALFLFNHHEDVVAIASSQKEICKDIYYYHHADHHLALGVYLDFAVHIDPHNIGYYNCRDHLNKKDNIYWPLVVEDGGCRELAEPFLTGGELKTCTCAGANKIEINYAYSYKDIVLGRLLHSSGIHYHVGWLTDEYLEEIRTGLRESGVDEDRFIYTRWVDSVWLFFLENNIDLYISSFPLGGGTTTIECLGSGTPVLLHDTYKTKFHSGTDIAYRDVMRWSVPAQLYEVLDKINSRTLAEHSSMGRDHYLRYYHPSKLQGILMEMEKMQNGIAPPELTGQNSDIDSVVRKINSLKSESSEFALLLNKTREQCDTAVVERDAAISERHIAISERDAAISERDAEISERDAAISERDAAISKLNDIYNSKSWKITTPLRKISAGIIGKKTDV